MIQSNILVIPLPQSIYYILLQTPILSSIKLYISHYNHLLFVPSPFILIILKYFLFNYLNNTQTLMASFLSSFLGIGQTQTKPQNTQLIDDEMMKSMEFSGSSEQSNKKSEEIPQQLHSQSSNSSGFQQIIIQDLHSPSKTPNQSKSKPNIPKSNFNLMDQSMTFDDDLNRSINQNPCRYIKQSNIAENDLMSFSYKSVGDQSFSDISVGTKGMEESFSNIGSSSHKANHQSFSDIQVQYEPQQPKDLLRITEKPEDDSDMEDDYQALKIKKSQETSNQVAENLSLWGITSRKDSYSQNETHQNSFQSNRESFSELYDGYVKPSNSKEIEYLIPMEESQDGNGFRMQEQIDLTMEKSIVAPTIKPAFNKKNQSKSNQSQEKSPVKTKHIFTSHKYYDQVKNSAQLINMGESIVMSPDQQQPRKKPSKQTKDLKNKQQNLSPFQIHCKDYVHFIRYGKTEDRLISQKLLQSMTEYFLIQNIMLPIFNIKLIEDVEAQMALQRKQVKMSLFTLCINLYFSFLSKKYPNQMRKFFEIEQSSKNLKSQVGISVKKQQVSPMFSNFYKIVFDYLKLNHYSKAQILKRTLQAQLAFVNEFKQTWLQSWSDIDPNMQQSIEEKQYSKRNSLDMQSVKDKELILLKKIAQLQVLICFQKSQMYCEQKLKQKMQENIWKERKRKLIEDRNFFITHFYQACFV